MPNMTKQTILQPRSITIILLKIKNRFSHLFFNDLLKRVIKTGQVHGTMVQYNPVARVQYPIINIAQAPYCFLIPRDRLSRTDRKT